MAILGGKFVYFCNRACKVDYLQSLRPGVLSAEVQTAEPPPTAPRSPPPKATSETPQPRADRAEDAVAVEDSEPASVPLLEALADDPPVDEVDSFEHEPLPPSQLESERSAEEPRERVGVPRILSAGAVGAGLLSLGLPLAGGAAPGARTALALGAIAFAMLRQATGTRTHFREGWLTVAALAGCGASLAWSQARISPHASTIAALTGLAAAAAVVVRELVERERRPVEEARSRLAAELTITARVITAEGSRDVDHAEVRAGEVVLLVAGDVAPVDGVVASGEATIVPWIDAPLEIVVREGEAVLAGAALLAGSLRLTTTRTGADRGLARLALSAGSGVDVAAPLPRLARQIATRGAPATALLAGAAALAISSSLSMAIAVASATLLALSAEATAAIVAASHARAHLRAQQRSGIIYKDAAAFDRAGRVDIAVACARGTLLLGEPEIVSVDGYGAWDTARVLSLAAALANGSTHPFALAIARAARAGGVKVANVRNTIHDGAGVTALDAAGDRIVLGRRAFLLSERVGVAAADARVGDLEAQGRSALLLACAGKIVGLVALQDGLRAGARAAVQRLLDAHIEPVMLSGESRETCETIGAALDIEHVRPEVMAADRGAEVRALADGGSVVAVIGRAPDDDSALGAADVSLALGAAGSAPGEWSVALASDDVRDAVLALTIPRTASEIARRALMLGLVPGVACALSLSLGWAPLWLGPLAGVVGTLAAALYARD